jgi:phosphoenolpyruvate synthase/pyruvate phosphate dikinase
MIIENLFEAKHLPFTLFGSKAHNLWRLHTERLPIIPGICVSVASFSQHINELVSVSLLRSLNLSHDTSSIIKISNAICSVLSHLSLHERFVSELNEGIYNCEDLQKDTMVVRSSGITEDSFLASFAGIYESYLPVDAAVVSARIMDCWRSYWSTRACLYRNRHNISHDSGMGVLIQRQFKFEIGGVLFTKHPLNDTENMYVEYSPGGPHMVVSGHAVPAALEIHRETGMIVKNGQCVQELITLEDGFLLWDYALRAEHIFGCAQDIEWGVSQGQLVIIQCRPMTSRIG